MPPSRTVLCLGFSGLLIFCLMSNAFAQQDSSCKKILHVKKLAQKNNISTKSIRALEKLYCVDGSQRFRGNENRGPVVTRKCMDLHIMYKLARMAGSSDSEIQMILLRRMQECRPKGGVTSKGARWPNRKRAQQGNSWYYPNGKRAKISDNSWKFANGKWAQSGPNNWRYPNGKWAQRGVNNFYTPDGKRIRDGIVGLFSYACELVTTEKCQKEIESIKGSSGLLEKLFVFEFTWRAKMKSPK